MTAAKIRTCREAKELRRRIAVNCNALLKTISLVVEFVEDDQPGTALHEIGCIESQIRGLRQMLEEAQGSRVSLVGDGDDVAKEPPP